MLRYLQRLASRDYGLAHGMIPLGSCTMKLNAAAEMIPITWDKFANLHPYCPPDQAQGYAQLFRDLEAWLAEITGFCCCFPPTQRRLPGRIRRTHGHPQVPRGAGKPATQNAK